MNSLTAGAAIAVCVAGWPLYSLVSAGSLDAGSALVRGGVVAVGCTIGVSFLIDLVGRYERQAETARRQKLTSLFASMQDAVSDGVLVDETAQPTDGTPARRPPSPGQSPPGS